jgi:hypothetical protein
MLFDPECSQAIQKAQNLFKKIELKHDLIYIKCHFQKIVESITQLEKTDLPLTESIGIVENIQKMLQKAPGSVAAIACKKLVTCLEKNEGFQDLHKLSKIFAGERADEDDCSAEDLMFKFAPITSCDVERSFSRYKNILADNRQRFTFENLEKYLIVNANYV